MAAIREQINERLIQALENGIAPWRRPWSASAHGGRHRNFTTQRAYSGVNPLLLELHNLKHGFGSSLWATFNQWKNAGCAVKKRPDHVKAGEWGCQIIFYKPVSKNKVNQDTGEEEENRFLVMRTFTVFNADQVNGPTVEQLASTVNEFDPHQVAEDLIAATNADIRQGNGDEAFYKRPLPANSWPNHTDGDFIALPDRGRFSSPASYYETIFHELAHWSEVRLAWDHEQHGYAMGELVAELSSCYLASDIGIESSNLENHASYLNSWLKGMRESSSFIFRASSQASKVTDFLLSFQQVNSEELAETVA